MLDLLAIGEVLLDVHAPELLPGRVVHAPIALRVGGTPVNAALAALAEGATAGVVGRIGDDAPGALARETLRAAGVEASLAVDPELPTGTFLAAGSAIAADRGASAALSPADLPAALRAGAVLVSPYAPAAAARAAVERAKARWVAAEGGNALFLNADEARGLTGAAPEEALAQLAARYRLVCVTLGAEGAIAALDGAVERRPPPERLAASPVGAGDVLAACVLVLLLRGAPLGEALERAVGAPARLRAGRP
ncbi:MAG: carbohydrate kinase family protein [Gaiellaceae bacterium]